MNDLTHLDLFSGIGGFALAAYRAGYRTVAFSEIEPYCAKILKKLWPNVPNIGDVRQGGGVFDRFRGATVCTAGYPCQPFSFAGNREGEADDRHLWPSAFGVIQTVRPTWFVGENVLGHVSMGLSKVISDLEGAGYAVQPFVIPACAIGAWHIRERVWILAHN